MFCRNPRPPLPSCGVAVRGAAYGMLRAASRRELLHPARGGFVVKRLSLAALCALPLLVALPNRLGAPGGAIRGRGAAAPGGPVPPAAAGRRGSGARTATANQAGYEIRGVPTGPPT